MTQTFTKRMYDCLHSKSIISSTGVMFVDPHDATVCTECIRNPVHVMVTDNH